MRTVIAVCCVATLSALLSAGWREREEWSAPSNSPDTHQDADLERLLHQATASRVAARYDEAMALVEEGHRHSLDRGAALYAARFTWGKADTLFSRQRYRGALSAYLAARESLEGLRDTAGVCAIDTNLASLYRHLGEHAGAIEAARRATDCRTPDPQGRRRRLLVTLGLLEAEQGRFEAAREAVAQGAAEADRSGDVDLMASAWDNFGGHLLAAGRLDEAEEALLAGYRLRKVHGLAKIEQSLRNLGMLWLERGDHAFAQGLLDAALGLAESRETSIANLHFYEARGRLRLAAGNADGARQDLARAFELARNQWVETPASRFARESAAAQVRRVAQRYAGSALREYAGSGREERLREAFEAVEEARAVSLAAHLEQPEADSARDEGPLLAELRAAEVEMLRAPGEQTLAAVRRARERLLRAAGGGDAAPVPGAAGLLQRVRRSLGSDTVLFSFSAGERETWLWVVTDRALTFHTLPGGEVLRKRIAALRTAIAGRSPDYEVQAAELFETLFGLADPRDRARPRWLLSLDAPLFEVPFAGLSGGGVRYLVETKTIRIISSAALFAAPHPGARNWDGPFLGVGDPVYNRTDPRLRHRVAPGSQAHREPIQFARLPASGREIETAAQSWGGRATLLTGISASSPALRDALAARPPVVHFAAHVVRGSTADANALIALSAGDGGDVEFLSPVEIAAWSARPGIVVLSGCGSGTAAASPGSGLMGLTHSWLMAGAGAVVASQWPTPDESGALFEGFYGHLRDSRQGPGWRAAEALRLAQREMLRHTDWRSEPRYWAAFFVLGNE